MKFSLPLKSVSFLVAAASVALLSTGCHSQKVDIKTDDQKISYGIGLDIGTSMKKQGVDIDPEVLAAGIRDAKSGKQPQISMEEVQKVMASKQQQIMAKRMAEAQAAATKNETEGAAFLAANKTKEGVKTTASGLQYKVIKEGTGKKPSAKDTVTVNYRGTFLDGNEFDSSYKRNEPATFPVNGVIPGWTEGLQLMSEGGKYEFFIPANLAYGKQGAGGGVIPGNATLVFEVELLKINPPAPAAAH